MSINSQVSADESRDLKPRENARVSGIDFNPEREESKEVGLQDIEAAMNGPAANSEQEIISATHRSLVETYEATLKGIISNHLTATEITSGNEKPRKAELANNFAFRMSTPKTADGKHEFDLIKHDEPVKVEIHDLNLVDETSETQLRAITRLIQGEGDKRVTSNVPYLWPVVTPLKKDNK